MTVAAQVMVMAIVLSITLLFIGIGMLIFIHVCVVGRAFRRGFGNIQAPERGAAASTTAAGNTSMSKDDLEKLPSFDYNITKDTASDVDCAVCLESFQMGDKCRLLPTCNHSFHAQCVDTWLIRTPFCPICRTGADSRKGSSRFSTDTSLELRGDQSETTGSSSRLSDIRIDHGDDQLGESQRREDSGHDTPDSNEFRMIQTQGRIQEMSVNCSVSGVESELNIELN
ncbi:43kDa postsynaptic protein [Parasponia andersonii]|uniref:RING-type E3 ubiquitin transferase n=1 Tax=Parasponia andersonii TaxID=3476 RepID=A0A2P5A9S3_PARAD|nr:43kDa postsynaptic protein [Parasponia andersonii]